MKISDISSAKKQRAAYMVKTSLKTVGKLGLGAAAVYGTSGLANILGVSAEMSGALGLGSATGGIAKSISLRPRFTNLTRAEQLKIHKKIQHK